ncbi:hypothetical protein [Paenibacillus alkalitolerans]|uniref:hypothetical protein n=1 Tax=Paenibacillus alkalitolerans TaxID=2799335 RepID=UPI0018F327E8|nr:hypothetical protein [Paenibacillus alkalitolerans]
MKLTEWLIAVSLVIVGLSCLTMSATSMMNPSSLTAYLNNLIQICLWIGIPAVIAGILYIMIRRKKGDPK